MLLLAFLLSPAEMSHSINVKRYMDGRWKRPASRSRLRIPQKVGFFIKPISAHSGSHSSWRGASSGPLGMHHTSTNHILFHMEGRLWFSMYRFDHTSRHTRILIISSKAIAKIAWETASSSRVTIKWYALETAKPSTPHNSPARRSLEWFSRLALCCSRERQEKCPRCGHTNLNLTAYSSWIQWQVPLNFYTCRYLVLLMAAASAQDNSELQRLVQVGEMAMKQSFHRPRMSLDFCFCGMNNDIR